MWLKNAFYIAVSLFSLVIVGCGGGGGGSSTPADPNAPNAITLAASPGTGATSNLGPVTLTATVTPAGPGGTIANGTPVTFTIQSGTGTLSAVTTTTGGVATATLNSTTANTVTVNATVGSAPVVTSNTVSVPFTSVATVKVRTTGTLPGGTTIGGINVIVSASPSTGLSIAASDISATGVGTGSTILPNTTNVASVVLGLINTTGIQTGEFATLQYHVAAGASPIAGDFSVALSGPGIIDTLGVNIPGITVSILSVTIQ